ncbi:phosphoenolpyruvate synthase [Chitinophaga ginsengisoli]|uniref:Phosphoenolpyruvate synthase n=1 Tax=Chitinophaga ginsengisoli TaxID=363837 RepID=A0A2P8FM75_9BACT|nr:phosphoenolpyruvate synthase [Chitinophaga ginsengisoli]PSL22812.1 phosphoenolpyruvate synthase [Chitinophaga ginsengisoli]
METRIVIPLQALGLEDIPIVGGKCASLGEMIANLSKAGINIPSGFAITTTAYYQFLRQSGLEEYIREQIEGIDFDSLVTLRRAGQRIRQAISNTKFPHELSTEIISAYMDLSREYGQDITDVAVRSSATTEDLPDASFAGQQETYLNVRGPAALIDAVRNCFASLFTDRAISYRQNFGYDHFSIGLSVCVQKMVRSDLGAAGVAFSLDTESGFKDVVVINGSFGLGEMVVQGAVSPDEFIVFKPALNGKFTPIIEKRLGIKDKMMIYGESNDQRTKVIPVERGNQQRFCLRDKQIMQLAEWVCKIEDYYTQLKGKWCPMDIEWAQDGLSNELFIVQARPETIHSQKEHHTITSYAIESNATPLLKGIAVGDKIASGKVNILFSLDKRVTEGTEFKAGDVLVTDMTDPDWEPIMKMAAAIVTNKGGRTCHAAIVAREMGIPAIVGCGNATELLSTGQDITISCAEGDEGIIYDGLIPFKENSLDLRELPEIKTALMLNVASPAMAFQFSHLPNKGVGLAREEFIINNYIKVHPLALLHHKSLNDANLTADIMQLIRGYDNEEAYFVQKLAYGIAKIAAAFHPGKVIVRFSDFKSNEYYNLLGGKYFEPKEENPMIGWRGASRYYSDKYKAAFALECKAIKKVREEMGLRNVVVMIPFCRTVEELLMVLDTMKEYGIERGRNGLEVYLMAEIPSNIMMAEEFAAHIDGFSIGSNDLTQLTLGLDRDSSLIAGLYNERNPAVLRMISMLITAAKKQHVKVGICGQGPSDFPDFTKFLVEQGIDSISVTPDALTKTVKAIHEAEEMKEQIPYI